MRKFRLISGGYHEGFVKGNIYDESFRPFSQSGTAGYYAERYPEDWEEVFEVPDYITERAKLNQLSKDPQVFNRVIENKETPIHQTPLGYYAGIMASRIDPPKVFIGEKETSESYSAWSKKCVRMAQELIKELENEAKTTNH